MIDSLRSDRLGAYGSGRNLTPFLDGLAADSLVYERAYAASSWTLPSVASLFLGSYPSQHRVVRFFEGIREEDTTLAEMLAARGYATWGVTANATIKGEFGFGQGFERYELVGEPTFFNPKSDGRLINDTVLRWVDEVGDARPHFVYLHYTDPHAPYRAHEWTPPPPPNLEHTDEDLNLRILTAAWEADATVRHAAWNFDQADVERLEQLYDSEVRYSDQLLSELFAALDDRGFLDRAIVVVTADHGEEFGEHGMFYHGVSLYEPAIRVPLLIRHPDRGAARVAQPVEVAGLAARLVEEVNGGAPAPFVIRPLPWASVSERSTYAFSELVETEQHKIWLHRRAVMNETAKLLVTSGDELQEYALADEPVERRRLPGPLPDLHAALEAFQLLIAATQGAAAPVTLDEATRDRLKALGYFPEGR